MSVAVRSVADVPVVKMASVAPGSSIAMLVFVTSVVYVATLDTSVVPKVPRVKMVRVLNDSFTSLFLM